MKFIIGQPVCQKCGHTDTELRAFDCDIETDLLELCDACGENAVTVPVAFALEAVWPHVDTLVEFGRAIKQIGVRLHTLNPKPEH